MRREDRDPGVSIEAHPTAGASLRPALGVFDLVLLNIVTIVGLRWISTAAALGPSGLSLWIIASVLFFVPSGLAVQELSSRNPHEGGVYLWAREAFGETHGFIAGWAYTLSNLVFFPSLLLFISGVSLHIVGGSWLSLADNPLYNGLVCLALLWGTTALNILGLKRAKWLQNLGGVSTLCIAVVVLAAGLLAWWRFGAATPMTLASLTPDATSIAAINTLAVLILGYDGFELGPVMGDEIRDSARTVRRAIVIGGGVIALIYIAGTVALLAALRPVQISAIGGIPEALEAVGQRAGWLHVGALAAVLLTAASIGGLSGWLSSTARLPFVMGLAQYLPRRLGATHPRYGTPHVALLVQAVLASLVLMAAVTGSAVHEAYQLLIDMTVALVCIVWVYIFAALAVLRSRAVDDTGVSLIPGGPLVCWALAAVGGIASAFATIASMLPPEGSANPTLFMAKGVGGCLVVIVSGVLIVRRASANRIARARRSR